MARTPWPHLTLKTSDGDVKPLLGLASGFVEIMGVEVAFYACIIDPSHSGETDYNLLLGIPWLAMVKGVHDVSRAQVSITCPTSGVKAVVKGPTFRPIDFKRLFLEVGGRHGQLHEEAQWVEDVWGSTEDGSSEYEEESSEEEDDESGSEDEESVTGPQNSPAASALRCRGAILELPNPAGKARELRYIEAHSYLKLYGQDAPYSHLAKRMTELLEDLRHGPEGEAILIADHDGRSVAVDGKEQNFSKCGTTVN